MLIFRRCLIPTMSLFSSAKSSDHSNMDFQHISREHAFSEASSTLLTSPVESSAFQLDFPAATNSKAISTGFNNRTTIVEERSYPQSPHLLLTLPQKRSNHSPISGTIGDVEESHPRAFTEIYSAKRLKGSDTLPLPNPPWSCKITVATGSSRPLIDSSKANTVSPERADPAKITADQLNYDRPKTLRSPFEYTPKLLTSQIDIQRANSNRPVRSERSIGYIYYAPTNCSDKTNQQFDAHRRVPRRQLFYGGDPPSKPGPRSLHKTAGSWELRHEVERDAEDYDLDSWSDGTLNASAARPYRSEPIRSKPRLWLDLSEEKDNIQEAVSILKLQVTQKQLPKSMLIMI